MENNQELISIVREIRGESDRLVVWNSSWFNFEKWRDLNRECPLYQWEFKEYNPQTKRLWVYVNKPEGKLKYIFGFNKIKFRPGQLLVNPNCKADNCCEGSRKFNQREKIDGKVYEFAYQLTKKPIHEFKKGNSLQELQNYRHENGGYLFYPKPTRSFVYISSYLDLVNDILTGKVQ